MLHNEDEGRQVSREASTGNAGGEEKVYTTQLTQLLLCGTAGWAINRTSYELTPIAFGTFTFLLGHGILGLLKYTTSEENKRKIRPWHRYSSFVTRILPLPLINMQIYLDYERAHWMAYSHLASIVIPSTAYVFGHGLTNTFVIMHVLSNAASLAYISFVNENYWTLGLSTLTVFNELSIDFLVDKFSSVPPVDLWTSALAIFVIFAIKALDTV